MNVVINGIEFTGNPCRVVTAEWNGKTFTAGERLWAHLFSLQEWLEAQHLNWYVYVVQGAYRTDVDLSAGTHDYDGTVDVYLINRKSGRRVWARGIKPLRKNGFAAWLRNTGSWLSPSTWHFHMNSLGTAPGCKVGVLIPQQNSDYYEHKTGLFGHLFAPGWYPKDIAATVFDYPKWLREKEDEMAGPKDWTDEDWAVFNRRFMDAPLNVKDGGPDAKYDGWSLRRAIKTVLDRLPGGGDKK